MRNRILMTMLAAYSAAAQTQIDLRTQAKSVDFTAAGSTKPLKTGPTLPAVCTTGEVFFKTSAPAGANLYACTAANTWSAQGGSSSGALTMESSGSVVGSRAAVNMIPGAGMTTIMTDTGSQINMQMALDSAVVETQPNAQAGAALLCASTGGSASNYQCAMHPTVGAYTAGMLLHWVPDVNGAGGGTTLNVDTLGATPLKQSDGAADPGATDIVAGRMYSVWYDGSAFRLAGGAASFSYTPENAANKGQPNGYAGLDASGKVASSLLPASTPMASQSASVNLAPLFDGVCEDATFAFNGVTTSTQLVAGLPSNLPAGVDAVLFANSLNSVDVRVCNHSGVTQTMGSYVFTAKTPIYFATASASLSFGSVPDGACAGQTFALSGASAGDPVAAGFPSALAPGLAGSMNVSAGNTVNVSMCNYSGATWSAAPQTYVASIVK
jgi:hypothetical protein